MNYKFLNLTEPQKAILSTEQFYPNTSINTISAKISIHSEINFELLQKAINIVVQKISGIRYQLHLDKDIVTQYEKEYNSFMIDYVELNPSNEKEILHSITHKTFSLYDSPLYYFEVFKNTNNNKGGFFICIHHIISDAWSTSMLVSLIISIYSQLIQNKTLNFETFPSFSYEDFINQEEKYVSSNKYLADKDFWNIVLDESTFEPSFIGNSSSAMSCIASRSPFNLSKSLTSEIVGFCKELKISPFTFILFLMGIYESKINQTSNVVLSTPILNRSSIKDKKTFRTFCK